MRIVVAGWLRYAGDMQTCNEIILGAREHILASRAETGCAAYTWAVDPLEPGVIQVFEEWDSEVDLLRHFQDPSYAAMRDHLGQWEITGFGVQLYSAAGIEPVYDENGVARREIFGVSLA
ncbi:putative quinol monooxygenase [Novosphingobium sp. Leaf2]|uniref:putative quinol monooxygenase n=1 Tax=Novosphingobium sp. Leaf2 TaxID=1735670 RepID=UPI0006FCBE32|nr:antibiotic biosynthesis monooxygenase [Novosphingobium sp. Leaf2]KQM19382.1 antibiotic biosynthesis monooxygenase [Novosphingobium sp. Leaf2]